jgi:hypothetical protein
MPGPRNNKKKASKKPETAVCTAPEAPTNVPVDIFTREDVYLAATDAFLHAVDQTKVLRMLWEIAYGLGDLKGLEEGKEKGLEEGRKLGLEEPRSLGLKEGRKLGLEEGQKLRLDKGRSLGLDEGRKLGIEEGKRYYVEGDLTRAFNRGTRQGRADKQNQWIEVGHCEEGACIRDSHTFVSIGIGLDVASTTRTFVDIKIGPDIIAMPTAATTYTHESAGTQSTIDKLLPTKPPVSAQFSWAEDAASIPIVSLSTQILAPHDFLVLQSESKTPFGTLQRHYHRSRGTQRTCQHVRTLPIQRTYTP